MKSVTSAISLIIALLAAFAVSTTIESVLRNLAKDTARASGSYGCRHGNCVKCSQFTGCDICIYSIRDLDTRTGSIGECEPQVLPIPNCVVYFEERNPLFWGCQVCENGKEPAVIPGVKIRGKHQFICSGQAKPNCKVTYANILENTKPQYANVCTQCIEGYMISNDNPGACITVPLTPEDKRIRWCLIYHMNGDCNTCQEGYVADESGGPNNGKCVRNKYPETLGCRAIEDSDLKLCKDCAFSRSYYATGYNNEGYGQLCDWYAPGAKNPIKVSANFIKILQIWIGLIPVVMITW